MPEQSPDGPIFEPGCKIDNSTFGPFTKIGADTRVLNSEFGAYSYCDRFCDFANVTVGKFSNIATNVRVGATDHPLDRATLHHFMYRQNYYWDGVEPWPELWERRAARRSSIGHDTWIGHAAIIKPEVTLGHGAVVASGAIVTKDVEPYAIVAGVPARVVRMRQPRDLAERMIALAWWDWDSGTLKDRIDDFRNLPVEAFLEKYGG